MRTRLIFVAVVLIAAVFYQFFPLLGCLSECHVDLVSLHGDPAIGNWGLVDSRLNTWILGSVHNALATDPLSLFDGQILYPAKRVIAGSEHLVGLALPSLPLRLITQDALTLYNLVLVATSLVLAASTVALVLSLTANPPVALLVGVATPFLSWRITELSHLQLEGVHLLPLVWLFTLRILAGLGRNHDARALLVVLILQLLTSYYIAYALTWTLLATGVSAWLLGHRDRGAWARVLVAVAGAYAVFLVLSIPYLVRQARGALAAPSLSGSGPLGEQVARVLEFLSPSALLPWAGTASRAGLVETANGYALPVGLVVAALAAIGWATFSRKSDGAEVRMRTLAVVSLSLSCLGAYVFMLGNEATLFGRPVTLPGGWASALIPGFANLRAPHRWGITICLAVPVLAGLGLHQADGWLSRRAEGGTLVGLRTVAGILLALTIPWASLPADKAQAGPFERHTIDRTLAKLPPGPVLEIPWYLDTVAATIADTHYMLGATRHGKPLLNGFTAYPPPTFLMLRRIAAELPSRDAVERLSLLVGLRWIVVHQELMTPPEREAWSAVSSDVGLRKVEEIETTSIFEVVASDRAGEGLSAMKVQGLHGRTATGLSRDALDLGEARGELRVTAPVTIGEADAVATVPIQVRNSGGQVWPGLDPQWDGLVVLRYVFDDGEGRVVGGGLVGLDRDIGAGEKVSMQVRIDRPRETGDHRLCLDLVRFTGDGVDALPLRPAEAKLQVPEFRGPTGPNLGIVRSPGVPRFAPTSSRCAQPKS